MEEDLKLSPILAIPRTQFADPLQLWDFLILAAFCPSELSFAAPVRSPQASAAISAEPQLLCVHRAIKRDACSYPVLCWGLDSQPGLRMRIGKPGSPLGILPPGADPHSSSGEARHGSSLDESGIWASCGRGEDLLAVS